MHSLKGGEKTKKNQTKGSEPICPVPDHPAPRMLEEGYILQGRLLSIEDGPEGA
jgi:hypothetical protein